MLPRTLVSRSTFGRHSHRFRFFDPGRTRTRRASSCRRSARSGTPDDRRGGVRSGGFPDQPIGRPILGGSVKLSAREIRAYLDRFYGANAMIVSAAGAVRHDEVRPARKSCSPACRRSRRRRMRTGALCGRRAQVAQERRAGQSRDRFRASRISTRRITPRISFAMLSAAACRAYSGSARSVASPIRSTRSTGHRRHRPVRLPLPARATPRELMKVSLDCLSAALDDLDETEVSRAGRR